MKKLPSPIVLLFCSSLIIAQTNNDDYYSTPKTKIISKDRVTASIMAGAGVSFLNTSKNAAFTTFVAPKIGYQLTDKFRLNIGLMHYTMTGNTFMSLNRNESFLNTSNKAVSGNLVFVEGQYLLKPRLLVSGSVMVDANGMNIDKKNNYKAASLGLDYKVSEHASIGIRATISEGQQNYYNNPFPTSSFGQSSTFFSNNSNSVFR